MSAAKKKPSGRSGEILDRGLAPARWAKVQRIRLIRREVREALAPGALELLFERADVVVEGGEEITPDARGRVYATVMVTIDLRRSADRVCERADTATAERIAELMVRRDEELRDKLTQLARPQLARIGGVTPEALELSVEPHVRADGLRVLIDGDAVAWPRARRKS